MPAGSTSNNITEERQTWSMAPSAIQIAARPILSRQHLYDVLRERKLVSPALAVRLGKLFGDGAGVWVRMQAAYDTWNAERQEDVSKIPTLRVKAA